MSDSIQTSFFVDFDGTIVSNKTRLYQFACDYLTDRLPEILSLDEFWGLKRLGINEHDVAGRFLDLAITKTDYALKKLRHIEDDQYLELDYLIPNARKALLELKDDGRLILVSRRERREGLQRELDRFLLADLFDEILTIKHDGMTKAECIKLKIQSCEKSYVIGDTEDDIEAAETLGIHGAFVLTGIRTRALLANRRDMSNLRVFGSLYDFAKAQPYE